MSPLFLTKVDTPTLYTGPSMFVWTYHLPTRISVNTLSKITHRRIYLLCRGHHNVQYNTRSVKKELCGYHYL